MKKIIIILAVFSILIEVQAEPVKNDLFILSTSTTATPKSMTLNLKQAIKQVLNNNPSIKQAQATIKASSFSTGQKKSKYYPSLNFEANYTRLDPDPFIQFPGLGTLQFFPEDNYDVHLGIHQTVLDFGKTRSLVAAAKLNEESAKYSFELTKTNIVFQTIQIFYSILLLEQSIQVQDKQINSLNEYLEITKKKVASGSGTDFDSLTIKVKLSESKNQKIDLENMLNKQKISFDRLLGTYENVNIQLQGDFSEDITKLEENSLIANAMILRPEMKLSKLEENIAKNQLQIARHENNPSINLAVLYGFKNGYFPDLNELKGNIVGLLQAEMQIFDGNKTKNQVREYKEVLVSVTEHEKELKNMVISEIRQEISDVNTNTGKLNASKLHIQLAQEAVKQAKIRYESGVITNLELLNAETSLAQANLFYLQSLYNYVISRVALKKAAGLQLSEFDY